ncbi:MAG: dihydroorotase [Bacteroidota bacterium]|nr:dihydroorotase [Bacteroidota bacterium]
MKEASNILIVNAVIVNEGRVFKGAVSITDDRITDIFEEELKQRPPLKPHTRVIDANGKYLLPGVIDDQVHFREPGLVSKADIQTESRAAVAGGVTSFMDMPNTNPQTLTQKLLEEKYALGAEKSIANYSFYMGASNDNLDEILKTNPGNVCGIKVFMGASTGNMLVDDQKVLAAIFEKAPLLIATHCEDEETIKANIAAFKSKYGDDVPVAAHPLIRSVEACYKSTSLAISLAKQYNTRLHVLHLSTGHEMVLFDNEIPLEKKRITAEVCVHHLWFSDEDYEQMGMFIKWNPAVKTSLDREILLESVLDDRIDVIATDHAPHTLAEKNNSYFKAPSGGPLVQHSLVAMLELSRQGKISVEKVVEKMCHAPAVCFQVAERGFIRKGYKADLTLVDMNAAWTVAPENIYYKCGWSPFEGLTFNAKVTHTFVNGQLVYENGSFNDQVRGERLLFNR